MESRDDLPRNSLLPQAFDLIEQLEKERLELEADVLLQLIPPHEAQQIRLSINRITADLEARLGITRRTVEQQREPSLEPALGPPSSPHLA